MGPPESQTTPVGGRGGEEKSRANNSGNSTYHATHFTSTTELERLRLLMANIAQGLIDILDYLEGDPDFEESEPLEQEDDPAEDSDVDEDDDPAEEDDPAEQDDPGGEEPNEDTAGGCYYADSPYLRGRAEARQATRRWLKALAKRRAAQSRSEVSSC